MDLRFALRSLRKNPGFTLLAISVLALGIGANTAVFSVVNSVLLKPLDYAEPDRIVRLSSFWKKTGLQGWVSAPDFLDWRDQSSVFSAMSRYNDFDTAVIVGQTPEYGHLAVTTRELFHVFAITPEAGRVFQSGDEKTRDVVVVSDSFAQSHFGNMQRAIAQTVSISGRPRTIVGVLPPGFHFPQTTDVWLPDDPTEVEDRSAHNYLAVARLKPGVSLSQAEGQMSSIGARLQAQYPKSNGTKSVAVTRMLDDMVRNVRLTLILLLGAVGVLLLISCANTANLLLAKATARTREMAVRAAVGASRGRIVRQLVTESLVLAIVSGVVGLALALWGSAALVALAPRDVPRLAQTSIDGWVLGFTLGASLVASLLFGLAPALQASRVDLNEALKQGALRSVVGGRSGRIRNTLVVAEIALSMVLLSGAGLLIKSFAALNNVQLGYRPERVLVMRSSYPVRNLEAAKRGADFYKGLLDDISTLPSVIAAGGTRTLPGFQGSNGGFYPDHLPEESARSIATVRQGGFSMLTPHTFAALSIPVKQGRDFTDADAFDSQPTAIINQKLAETAFAGMDPVGHVIYCGFDSISMHGMKIVGVVGDIRQLGPSNEPRPEIYMPATQHPFAASAMAILVRTNGDPSALARTLRRKVRERSPDVPVTFTSLEATLSENVAAPRFRALLLGTFAALAVCLAVAGVYGVMAFVVGQRSNEIGLRMALGASSGAVQRLVMRQGMTLACIGIAVGLVGAIATTRLLGSLLFEVKPGDPLTLVGVAILLLLAAITACYLPARRASRIDPMVALRVE